jgi:hypothetical protein
LKVADGERVPVRLVQENGNTISLDATSIDMVVERQQSAFGIPLADAKKMAIDLNQAVVGFEIQGVFTDDEGQEASSQAKAVVDLNHTQTLFDQDALEAYAEANTGGKQGKKSAGNKSGTIGNPTSIHLPTRKRKADWQKWQGKYMSFPVAYWVEQNQTATGGLPITSGLVARFNADSLVATNMVGGALTHGATVNTWVDSVSSITANKVGSPIYRDHGIGGQPYVYFDGSSRFDITFNANLNPADMTIFAVARTYNDNGAAQSIIVSRETTNEGYALFYNMTGSENEAKLDVYDSGTATLESGNGTVSINSPNIIAARVPASGTKQLFQNGEFKATHSTAYNNSDAATTFIGASDSSTSNPFVGSIYEIVIYNRNLSLDEMFQVEGYLSSKYNIPLIGALGGEHRYKFFNFQEDADSVRVVFDAQRVASKNEPYGFVNKPRHMTGLTVGGGSTVTSINVSGGDPREWIELTNSSADYHIKIKEPTTYGSYRVNSDKVDLLLKVTGLGASSITCEVVAGLGASISTNDEIHLAPCENLGPEHESSSYGGPVLVLPIENAFTEITALGQTLSYVDYPAYENTDARTEGKTQIPTHANINGDGKRADEFITYQLSKLLTSTLEISERAVNAAGNKTIDKVFTTAIKKSGDGFETRLGITQVHATSLGTVNNKIRHNFGVGTLPTVQGFTGGKAGKQVKSAGDKVQDILGILGNSNNFDTATNNNSIGRFVSQIGEFVTDPFYGERDNSDYIYAIQIPYDTSVTKGNSNLDAQIAQRNHWVMTDDAPTFEKMAVSNDTHASKDYAPEHDGSRRNGIHGIITDFHVHRDAEMKAYEFALKFVAANVII